MRSTLHKQSFPPVQIPVFQSLYTHKSPSSETQGQIVGARESLNGRKNKARSLLFFCAIFFRLFRLSLAPTVCPWVSEDDKSHNVMALDTQQSAYFELGMPVVEE